MKKLVLLSALLLGVAGANAQVTNQGSKFTDNWSFTLKGGAIAPYQNFKVIENTRGIAGIELRKQVTSVLGLGIEGEATVNTSSWSHFRGQNLTATPPVVGIQTSPYAYHSKTVFDHSLVGAFATINFNNWFGGYKGYRQAFEVEGVLGAGWWHAYGDKTAGNEDAMYTKAGLNLNFNLGEAKAWTIALKPAIVWNMEYNQPNVRFHADNAAIELQAGLTYHFGNSNGAHYMTYCPMQYTQADMDRVNDQVNSLRGDLSKANSDLNDANARVAQLQRDLDACRNQKPKVVEVEKKSNSESLETNVFFEQGKSVVTRAQMPNVERVATFLKNHKDAKVEIVGYASPEGSREINDRLSAARANAVKDLLIKKYGIKANRIVKSEGQGVGKLFSEPDWNRVSICTIVTDKK